MNFLELSKLRGSYRKEFTDKKVTKDEMRYILEVAYLSPTGCNLQTPRFVGVIDEEKVKKLSDIYGHEWAKSSTGAVVIATKPLAKPGYGDSRYKEDFGAAAQALLLAIAELGYATTWIQGQIEGDKAEEMTKLLNIEDEYQVIGYFPIGEPKYEINRVKKLSFDERCFLDEYNNKF